MISHLSLETNLTPSLSGSCTVRETNINSLVCSLVLQIVENINDIIIIIGWPMYLYNVCSDQVWLLFQSITITPHACARGKVISRVIVVVVVSRKIAISRDLGT